MQRLEWSARPSTKSPAARLRRRRISTGIVDLRRLERPPRSAAAHPAAITACATAIAARARPAGLVLRIKQFLLRIGQQPFAHGFLAGKFSRPPDRLGLFPVFLLGRLFVGFSLLHLAKHAFALHFLFQDAERLIDVVVANEDLQGISFSWLVAVSGSVGFGRREADEIFKDPGD